MGFSFQLAVTSASMLSLMRASASAIAYGFNSFSRQASVHPRVFWKV